MTIMETLHPYAENYSRCRIGYVQVAVLLRVFVSGHELEYVLSYRHAFVKRGLVQTILEFRNLVLKPI